MTEEKDKNVFYITHSGEALFWLIIILVISALFFFMHFRINLHSFADVFHQQRKEHGTYRHRGAHILQEQECAEQVRQECPDGSALRVHHGYKGRKGRHRPQKR